MSKKESDIEWLYPDLMSQEGLIHILKKRYIKTDGLDLESLDKESLVQLYNQYILPLPKRKYKANRRGREMTRRQIQNMKKRKIKMDVDETDVKRQRTSSGAQDSPSTSRGLVSNYRSDNSSSCRLKPPPSTSSPSDKSVIKLGTTSVNGSSTSPGEERKAIKLKASGDQSDSTDTKKQKLENQTKDSPTNQKSFSKISWP